MRLILRTQPGLLQMISRKRCHFSTQVVEDNPSEEPLVEETIEFQEEVPDSLEEDVKEKKPWQRNQKPVESEETDKELFITFQRIFLKQYMNNEERLEQESRIVNSWDQVGHHVFHSDYSLINSPKGKKIVNNKLNNYEQQLNLKFNVLTSKLYDESSYYHKVAQYHLSEMDPLVASFIKQGYGFLDKNLMIYLIKNKKIKTLKQLMLLDAFEEANFIDEDVLIAIMLEVDSDNRSKFLLNLIPFEAELIWGTKPRVVEHTLVEEVKLLIHSENFTKYLYLSHECKEINKLRLLWSFQRYYLVDYSFFEYMIPQLKKLQFEVNDPFLQQQINKEINFILGTAFEDQALIPFFFNLVEMTKTYHNFFKSWSLVMILISKIKAIPKLVDENSEAELNEIFQLFLMNLPSNIGFQLMCHAMEPLLKHKGSNPLWYQNYRKCISYYMRGSDKHHNAIYHSPLSKVLNNNKTSFKVIYQQNQNAEPYARTVVTITKIWQKKEEVKPKNQADMIKDLLKGDYQSVLDHFLMRYSLASDFDLAARFQKQLSSTDKHLQFKSEQEKALYKLKQANNFFFIETYGQVFDRKLLKRSKLNLTVASTLNSHDNTAFLDTEEQKKQFQKSEKTLNMFLQKEGVNLIFGDENMEKIIKRVNSNQESEVFEQQLFEDENVLEFKQKINREIESVFMLENGQSLEQVLQLPLKEQTEKMKEYTNEYNEEIERISDLVSMSNPKEKDNLEQLKENILAITQKKSIEEVNKKDLQSIIQQYILSFELLDIPDEPTISKQSFQYANQLLKGKKDLPQLFEYKNLDQLDEQSFILKNEKNIFSKSQESKELEFQKLKTYYSKLLEKKGFDFKKQLTQEDKKFLQLVEKAVNTPSFKDIQKSFNQIENEEELPQIDKARQDRSISNAYENASVVLMQEKDFDDFQNNQYYPQERPQKDEIDEDFQIVNQLPELSIDERFMLQNIKEIVKRYRDFTSEEQIDMFDEEAQRPEKKIKNTHSKVFKKNKKQVHFNSSNKYKFSTQTDPVELSIEVTPEPELEQQTEMAPPPQLPPLDLETIKQYKKKEVDKTFYDLVKNENHIPSVGSGLTVLKYLFLQGKKKNAELLSNPNKKMNIEFTSVVGTRTKNYSKYIANTVFNYGLEDHFYEKLLEDQLDKFNRHDFKQIVAHMIYYKNDMTNEQVDLICKICQKHQIGYSFVEIAQFIKFNDIKVSEEALGMLTLTWHRFRIINEDMLTFVREYCKKMNIPFRTSFYSHFSSSLIKIKDFNKLRDLCTSVLTEIKPKPFKVDNTMKASDVPALEKAWKIQQNQQHIKMYFQLIENIVNNLERKIPDFTLELFTEYKKLVPELGEKELGYGLVCCCLNKSKFEQLMVYLQSNPKFGTEFMYDCLMKALLSNFQELQDYSERMFDSTVFINRLVLNLERIQTALLIFKKSTSSNSFSKFLEHCLRFQHDISKNNEIKKEMFFILNNNVEDVSVGGVFNLLDFIFNDKRTEERQEYRAVKLAEEEKSRKLAEIQGVKLGETNNEKDEKETKAATEEEKLKPAEKKMTKEQALANKQKLSKKDEKQIKKEKIQQNKKIKSVMPQIMAEVLDEGKKGDMEIVSMIRGQTKKHVSSNRKGVLGLGHLFEGTIELMKAEEEASKQAEKKVEVKGGKGAKETKKKK